MKTLAVIILTCLFLTPWVINAAKFVSCDFSSPYRCEAIHGLGVALPVVAVATMWFDSDGERDE